MKRCLNQIREEREKAKKGKARDDCPPRLPKGLEQMLRLIYQICADHKPLDIFKFIAKKLENRLNQRTLGENAELDYYYENEDDDFYREEFKSSKRVSMERDSSEEEKMTFASDTIPTEVFMSAYHNREAKYSEYIEDMIHYNLFDSLYDACKKSRPKKKKARRIKKDTIDTSQRKGQSICDLAWEINGKRSIYDPSKTPLAHYLKAHPEFAPALLQGKDLFEECKTENIPIPPPYWYMKKPKRKTKTDEGLLHKESTDTAGDKSSDLSECMEEDMREDLHFLNILIRCYAEIIDKPAEYAPYSIMETTGEDVKLEREDVSTQTDYCIVCASHNLIDGVQFFSPTCLKMLEKGIGLDSPCWSCMSYRTFVKPDWKEFFKPIPEKQPYVTDWLEEDNFVSNISFGHDMELKPPEPILLGEDEPYDEITEPSSPDPLPPEVYYSHEKQRHAISQRMKVKTLKWEAYTTPEYCDAPDILPMMTRLNICLPPGDKAALDNEPDTPSEFPQDMILSLHPIEDEAKPDEPDFPNILKRLSPKKR